MAGLDAAVAGAGADGDKRGLVGVAQDAQAVGQAFADVQLVGCDLAIGRARGGQRLIRRRMCVCPSCPASGGPCGRRCRRRPAALCAGARPGRRAGALPSAARRLRRWRVGRGGNLGWVRASQRTASGSGSPAGHRPRSSSQCAAGWLGAGPEVDGCAAAHSSAA